MSTRDELRDLVDASTLQRINSLDREVIVTNFLEWLETKANDEALIEDVWLLVPSDISQMDTADCLRAFVAALGEEGP